MRTHLLKGLLVAAVSCGLTGCSPEAKKARGMEKAGKYFNAGEFEKAKVEYLNVLQIDPQSSVAIERLGLIWYEQGALFRSFPILLQTRKQMPGNFDARTKLALAMIQVGRIAEARNEALAIVKDASAPNEAIVILADTIRTAPELEATSEAIKKSPAAQTIWGLVASAKLLLLKGDFPAANEILQRALRQEPKSPIVHSALAELYFRQGDRTKANDELAEAAKLSPLRSMARMRFAEYQIQSGAVKEAVAYLKDISRQAPDYLPAKRLQAQIALSEKKYDDAQSLLKEVFAIDAANIEGRLVEAQMLTAKGEVGTAIERLDLLRKANRGFAQVSVQLARAHLLQGHAERAIPVLEEGLSTHPEHVESVLLLAQLNLRAGKGQQVVEAMAHLLQQQPSLIPAQTLLISGLRSLGRFDDAIRIVREQVRVMPKNPEPHVVLGTILLQQKKPADARLAYEQALELAPQYIPAAAALVDLEVREKNFTGAMRRVQDQKSKNPGLAELYYLEATVYVAEQKWTEAEAALQKALELKPELSIAYDLLLQTYNASNNLPKAVRQLEETLARQPKDYRARLMSGIIYGQMNEPAKARDAYEAVLAAKPDDPLALNNLAFLYAENFNQLDRAVEHAEKARALEPESPAIADTLGWILVKRKEYPRGLELIREGATKMPDNGEMQFHLGVAHQMMGENDAARVAFERAASAPGEFRGKSEIKDRLAALARAPAPAPGAGTGSKTK